MNEQLFLLIKKLKTENKLSLQEYAFLIDNRTREAAEKLREEAAQTRRTIYGNQVFIRGLIEISNICKNNCLYCGIRKGNGNVVRYRLTEEEILECCKEGYELGFRTFVLQGGEDGYYTDEVLCKLIAAIKSRYPECAVTLSWEKEAGIVTRSYLMQERIVICSDMKPPMKHIMECCILRTFLLQSV